MKAVLHTMRHKKENHKGSLLSKILFISAIIFFILFSFVLFASWWILGDIPSMEEIKNYETPQASTIYDRHWEVLYTVHWKENRKVVPFNQIKNDTIYAVIALEDVNFFEHKWIDVFWVVRAILGQLRIVEYKWWGSTLTQQFVKNRFLSNERTIIRKIKEMILSAQIENYYTKEEIITMYLNQIPFWANIYWIEQASKQFFWKSSNQISLAESAIVASIPNATTYYSPYWKNKRTKVNTWISLEDLEMKKIDSYEKLIEHYGTDSISFGLLPKQILLNSWSTTFFLPWRSSFALDSLFKNWFITLEEKNEALKEMFAYEFKEFREDIKAPHFVMYIKKLIEEKYWENVLSEGWLKIITTLDLWMQKKAEEIVKRNVELNSDRNAENQSLLTVDTTWWHILAMVWSRDFFDKEIDGQVNVTIQKRLAWSTFKPIAYAAMLLAGYSPSTIIFDTLTDFWENDQEYIPNNFDWEFMWPISMRKSLWHSRNIPAIKAWIIWWIQKTYDIAASLWIVMYKNAEWYWSSIAIWTVWVTATELLEAYLVFANNWKQIESKAILKILTKNWVILEELKENSSPPIVLSPEVSYLITDMLSDKEVRGEWWNSRLQLKGRKNAIKTWTSNKLIKKKWEKDLVVMPLDWWTVGFTPQYATVVWAWNNNGSPMSVNASGWNTTSQSWHDFMTYLHEWKEALNFKQPDWIKFYRIAMLSWKLPKEDTPSDLITTGIFSEKNIPKEYDNSLSFVEVDKISKKLITAFTPEDAITKMAILKMHSLKPDNEKWETSATEWIQENWETFLSENWIENILIEPPQESDNIHTRENTINKPNIKIISPKNWGLVSKNWFSIMPEISSEYWVLKVEYYLEWELLNTAYNYPYKWEIELKQYPKIGSELELKIKAYDNIYNVWYSSLTVEIWNDDKAPFIEIVKPINNQKIIWWSSYEMKTLAYDIWSDIEKVVFYLDSKRIWIKTDSPYSIFFEVPEEEWNHTLKAIAFDKTWNKSSNKIRFESLIKLSISVEKPIFKIDEKLITWSPSEIQLFIPQGKLDEIEKIEFIARYKTISLEESETIISTINNPSWNANWVFYLTWQSPEKWEYQVYTKEYYKNRKVLKSKRVKVVVE